jgi:hypothetical protein
MPDTGCLMTLERLRDRRLTSHAGVSADAMYTSEQMLEKHLKTCHFLPIYERTSAFSTSHGSIGNPFPAREIERQIWCTEGVERPCGIGPPQKTATFGPPCVHYLEPRLLSRSSWWPGAEPRRGPSLKCGDERGHETDPMGHCLPGRPESCKRNVEQNCPHPGPAALSFLGGTSPARQPPEQR